MRPLYSLITACGLTVGTLAPSPAAAYPIDCAILLWSRWWFPQLGGMRGCLRGLHQTNYSDPDRTTLADLALPHVR